MDINRLLLRIRPIELAGILKGLLRISYREVPIGGRTFWLDPASNFGSRLMAEKCYEKELSSTLARILKPGDVFVDLGANEGYFSLLASELVGESGRVYSIEPQARLWPVIIRNFMLNGRTNYRLVPYAVGEAEGFIDLILNPSLNTGSSTVVKSLRRSGFEVQKAGILPLARVFERFEIERVAALKIDIEGFELNALRSLGSGLEEGQVDNILLETHPRQLEELGQSVAEVHSLLEKCRYRLVETGDFEHWARRA
jgi:FkbM family methyltransferase